MSSTAPLVSILIPAYNAGQWIDQTIRSALAQTWPRTEVIVVDDGSTDDTFAIAHRFQSEKVLVVGKENEGAAATRNRATALAQGDYIQWLDADDLLAPGKIERQLALLGPDPDPLWLLSGPWGGFGFRPQHARFERNALWSDLPPVEWLYRKMSGNLHMQTATWLTSRRLTELAGLWDTRLLSDDDGEFYCRVLLASKGTKFDENAKVFWRDIPGSRLSYIGTSDRKMDAMVVSMKLHIGYLMSLEDSPRTRTACRTYIRTWALAFHPSRTDIREELTRMAHELGDGFDWPAPRRKYAWLAPIFGDEFAWRSQVALPRIKARALSRWDRWMSHFDTRSSTGSMR